jgi:ornithine cyclodeaminase/alanine dehydrogenase-like protein (mu-crystallin family)
MRWLDAETVVRRLPPDVARQAVERALTALAAGQVHAPLRQVASLPAGDTLLMPAELDGYLAVKLLNVRPANRAAGGPTLPGVVVVFDAASGEPIAALDGPALTGVRTAAIAAVATRRLARAWTRVAVIGAGAQAPYQVEALVALGGVAEVRLYNRTPERALRLAALVRERHPEVTVRVAAEVQEATLEADVVTLVTSAREPILRLADVKPTVHVNAMGAYRPTDREVATDLVANATVYADTLEGCLAEAGDLLLPAAEGALDLRRVRPLAEALERTGPPSGMTLMKSVGAAAFDVTSAAWAVR